MKVIKIKSLGYKSTGRIVKRNTGQPFKQAPVPCFSLNVLMKTKRGFRCLKRRSPRLMGTTNPSTAASLGLSSFAERAVGKANSS